MARTKPRDVPVYGERALGGIVMSGVSSSLAGEWGDEKGVLMAVD